MPKFENVQVISHQDKKNKQSLNRLYFQARELILRQPGYRFDQVTDLLKQSKNGMDQDEAALYILESFQRDEGALPGELEEAYLELIFKRELTANRLAQGEDFYDIIKQINERWRQHNIIISKELLATKIDEYKQSLLN